MFPNLDIGDKMVPANAQNSAEAVLVQTTKLGNRDCRLSEYVEHLIKGSKAIKWMMIFFQNYLESVELESNGISEIDCRKH